jgi:hypothetical protein
MPSAELRTAGHAQRHELEIRQRALVAALVAGAAPPADLDGSRIRIQAAALIRKRARSVARAQPELAGALGVEFWPAFHRYAGARPGPPGCTQADAVEFARYLRRSGWRWNREVRRLTARSKA